MMKGEGGRQGETEKETRMEKKINAEEEIGERQKEDGAIGRQLKDRRKDILSFT